MSQQYDSIGELYERAKHLPIGQAEESTLRSALPDLAGRSVLDVGSGTGFYPRLFSRLGAVRVIGVDASPEMVAHARRVEADDPLGISYQVHDAAALPKLGEFDVVTAVWLLGYAPGEAALDGMLGQLVANLAPGGTLLVLVPNPDLDWARLDIFPRYGITATKTAPSHGRQGYAVHIDGEPPIDFEGFSWPPGVIEAALDRAGLADVRRHPPVVAADLLAERGPDYWADLLANPTFAVFTAVRPG
ncbi:class I SAM-dependent methyltransferase [Plantactinospora sp. BB1]|uniref:class I SAM-dependent methyltransferase n=1 Tax=Plantactinospora sp. BB1 TaxID=2071627 RepID=UPI000D15D195|nr:class I SAM-dependent methyltransferase [Plantactinospora sp. BB1]AVT40596.1 class I SAM-dependent methyltransferase [Plantactinospora sp. BB1]